MMYVLWGGTVHKSIEGERGEKRKKKGKKREGPNVLFGEKSRGMLLSIPCRRKGEEELESLPEKRRGGGVFLPLEREIRHRSALRQGEVSGEGLSLSRKEGKEKRGKPYPSKKRISFYTRRGKPKPRKGSFLLLRKKYPLTQKRKAVGPVPRGRGKRDLYSSHRKRVNHRRPNGEPVTKRKKERLSPSPYALKKREKRGRSRVSREGKKKRSKPLRSQRKKKEEKKRM